MERKNYRNDFSIRLTVKELLGKAESGFPDGDFRLVFSSGGRRYECSRKGAEYRNCRFEEGTLVCVFDNHGLMPGVLTMEARFFLPDTEFPDGNRLVALPPRALSLELVQGDGDETSEFSMDVSMPFAIITAYQMAVKAGYKGTEEEWCEMMTQGASIKDNMSFKKITSENLTNSGDINNGGTVHTKGLNVKDAATVKDLKVTGTVSLLSLEVQKANAAGGLTIYSPGGAHIDRIEEIKADAGNILGWKCYQLAQDASGNNVQQMLKQGDMCICANFNSGIGGYSGGANNWWWRRIGAITALPQLASDGKKYFSFVVIAANCASGSTTPKAGDTLVVLGNTTDKSRQNAIVVCAHDGIDSGIKAPYIAQYKGINDYDLASHRKSWWGYDAEGNASNHFVGQFTIGGSGDIDDTPIVRDRGAYVPGETYYYYDRVSYQGGLYLMTNKAAASTVQAPGGLDWTLQVSKGEKGDDGASIKIKGNAIAHYASAADISLETASDGYYLTDVGSSASHVRGITLVANGAIVNDIDVEDGDSYLTKEDGHLWCAAEGSSVWADYGKIKGDKGDPGKDGATGEKGDKGDKGEKGDPGKDGADGTNGVNGQDYRLVPNKEKLSASADGMVSGKLDYTIYLIDGESFTPQTPGESLYWRWKTELSNGEWNLVTTSDTVSISYSYEDDASDYVKIELVKDSAVIDSRIVPVSVGNDAYFNVNTRLAKAEIAVQGQSKNISKLQKSTLELTSDSVKMNTRMGKVEASISTSVQYDRNTGEVKSDIKLKADQIDLEGAISANKEFRIDNFGNVMTGVQVNPGADTNEYIVENLSNLVFDMDCEIYLPNDPEFIGRRIMIIAQPKFNSAGAVVKADGVTPVTDLSQIPTVTIKTGRTLCRWIYASDAGRNIYCSPNDESTSDMHYRDTKSALEGMQWFGGGEIQKDSQTDKWMMPARLSVSGGCVELLGVQYAVNNMYKATNAVRDGYEYRVHMKRSDDGFIQDDDYANGTIDKTASGLAASPLYGDENSPWQPVEQMCKWIIISAKAQKFDGGII